MRAAILTAGFAVLAGVLLAATERDAEATARAVAPATDPAIVAINPRATTATRADGSSSVELPWLLPGDTGAAVSPNGREIAFSSARSGSTEIYVADTQTGAVRRLTGNASSDDIEPAWSPNGRRLVWASGDDAAHDLFTMDADGSRKQRLASDPADEREPAWSPAGSRIAYASRQGGRYRVWAVPAAGGQPALLVAAPGRMRGPAWRPTGATIAYTGTVAGNADIWIAPLDGSAPRRATRSTGFDGGPAWSPEGRRLAFVSNRGGVRQVWLMRADGTRQQPLLGSEPGDDAPDWADVGETVSQPRGALLPDLDQQAPSGILVRVTEDKTSIGFTSAVDNIGDGPIHILGTRRGAERTMRADQLVHLRGGGGSVVPAVGRLAYELHPPHRHWHLEPYETYELRRASDGAFLGRDGKSGFCLLDRWGHALRRPGLVPRKPHFVGDCGAGRPDARTVDEGSSVGFTDRYPGFFHGQDIDITGLPPGLYVLVHRANPDRVIRELRYSNNDASALIQISPVDPVTGAPTVAIVRRCPASDRCQAG